MNIVQWKANSITAPLRIAADKSQLNFKLQKVLIFIYFIHYSNVCSIKVERKTVKSVQWIRQNWTKKDDDDDDEDDDDGDENDQLRKNPIISFFIRLSKTYPDLFLIRVSSVQRRSWQDQFDTKKTSLSLGLSILFGVSSSDNTGPLPNRAVKSAETWIYL